MIKTVAILISLAALAVPSFKTSNKNEKVVNEINESVHLIASDVNVEELDRVENASWSNPQDEPYYNAQTPALNHIGDISRVWDAYRGQGVLVAFVDNGIYYDHEEFNDANGCHVSPKSRAYYHEGSNYYYAELGSDHRGGVKLVPGLNDKGVLDYHGMYTSSLVGARINGLGMAGIAPEAEILMVKDDYSINAMYDAIKYAADCGADVISISQGIASNRSVIQEAVNYAISKGSIVVAAAGNDTTSTPWYPAACDNVIGVGALAYDSGDTIADYSNFNKASGDKNVDVVAPGTVFAASSYEDGVSGYTTQTYVSGTSFAAPIVAGAAALYKQKFPNATPAEFEQALINSAIDLGSEGWDTTFGYGKLDIAKLLGEQMPDATQTVSESATNIYWKDELGWCFRTLHLYGLEFAPGYSYADFERYMSLQYGEQVSRSDYEMEGTTGSWARNTAGDYDYLLNPGQEGPEYHVELPWWVTSATYQYVNGGGNWVSDSGCSFDSESSRHNADNKSYIYNNSGHAAVSTVDPVADYHALYPGFTVTQTLVVPNGSAIQNCPAEYASVYDHFNPALYSSSYYSFQGYFLNNTHTIPYDNSGYITADTNIYSLYIENPITIYFEDQGWANTYVYEKIVVDDAGNWYEPLGPAPGMKMEKIEGFKINGKDVYTLPVTLSTQFYENKSITLTFNQGSTTSGGAVSTTYIADGNLTCHNASNNWVTYSDNFNEGVEFMKELYAALNSVEAIGTILAGSVCGLSGQAKEILAKYNELDSSGKALVGMSTIYTYAQSGSGMANVDASQIIEQLKLLAANDPSSARTIVTNDESIFIIAIAMTMILGFALVAGLNKKKLFSK